MKCPLCGAINDNGKLCLKERPGFHACTDVALAWKNVVSLKRRGSLYGGCDELNDLELTEFLIFVSKKIPKYCKRRPYLSMDSPIIKIWLIWDIHDTLEKRNKPRLSKVNNSNMEFL